jgi:hypothetical protein
MPIYHQLGKIPDKRHVVFPKPDGGMYSEQLFGTIGFDGMSTNMYHIHRPTQVKAVGEPIDMRPQIARPNNMESLQLKGFQLAPKPDFLQSRVCVLTNADCDIELAIEQVMTKDVLTIQHKDTVYDAALLLSENEFHALPVMDEDELVGIVTTTDLIKFLLTLF